MFRRGHADCWLTNLPVPRRCRRGRTLACFPHHRLRPGVHSGQALLGHAALGRRVVQPAARQMRVAAAPAIRLPEGGRGRRARRNDQGLRIREGPVRHFFARGTEGTRRGEFARRRGDGVPADRRHRSGVLRQGLLSRARQGRRQALFPVRRGDAQDRPQRGRRATRRGASSTSSCCVPRTTCS
jgi:hypothetical protein